MAKIIKVEKCEQCPYHRTIRLIECPRCNYDGYETCSYAGNRAISKKIGKFPKNIPKWCPLEKGAE